MAREFDRHGGILKSDALSSEDASYFIKYRDRKLEPEHYTDSLKFLCECIKKATGKNTVILIDEYDVPLESSFYDGYSNIGPNMSRMASCISATVSGW